MLKKIVSIFIPTAECLGFGELRRTWDKTDPTLTQEGLKDAKQIASSLMQTGMTHPPEMIITGNKRKSFLTAQDSIQTYGSLTKADPAIVFTTNYFSRPDHAEYNPADAKADAYGYLYQGEKTSGKDWFTWFITVLSMVSGIAYAKYSFKESITAWYFAEPSFFAAAYFLSHTNGKTAMTPSTGQLEKKLPTIAKTFTKFEHRVDGVHPFWKLIPKP